MGWAAKARHSLHVPQKTTSASSISKPAAADGCSQGATEPAHQVVMVIADPGLVAGRGSGGLDGAHQTGAHACPEHIVDGLRRHRTQRFADLAGDFVCGRMRLGGKGFQNGNPRRGHPESGGPQQVPGIEVTRRGHPSSYTPFLESVKKSGQGRAGAVVLGAPGACGGSGGWKPGPPGPNGPEAGGLPNSPRGPIGNIGGPPRCMIAWW